MVDDGAATATSTGIPLHANHQQPPVPPAHEGMVGGKRKHSTGPSSQQSPTHTATACCGNLACTRAATSAGCCNRTASGPQSGGGTWSPWKSTAMPGACGFHHACGGELPQCLWHWDKHKAAPNPWTPTWATPARAAPAGAAAAPRPPPSSIAREERIRDARGLATVPKGGSAKACSGGRSKHKLMQGLCHTDSSAAPQFGSGVPRRQKEALLACGRWSAEPDFTQPPPALRGPPAPGAPPCTPSRLSRDLRLGRPPRGWLRPPPSQPPAGGRRCSSASSPPVSMRTAPALSAPGGPTRGSCAAPPPPAAAPSYKPRSCAQPAAPRA